MRQLLAKILALFTGTLVLVLSILFALMQNA